MYVAAGPGPHGTVILLHGFPGNEKNLDLAQAIRRDGWNVLYFDYRGSWGSPGNFSFTHSMEDAQAALDYLRDSSNAQLFRANPKEIVLIGHSMGGLIAAYTAAHNRKDDPKAPNPIAGIGLISAADMAGRAQLPPDAIPETRQKVLAGIAASLAAEGMAPLAGCTPESLAAELIANAQAWSLPSFGPSLAQIPTLIVTSDDGLAPANDALVDAIHQANGEQVKKVHSPPTTATPVPAFSSRRPSWRVWTPSTHSQYRPAAMPAGCFLTEAHPAPHLSSRPSAILAWNPRYPDKTSRSAPQFALRRLWTQPTR
jgi:pimeloyl-ACP methyl ester carboxylesterase